MSRSLMPCTVQGSAQEVAGSLVSLLAAETGKLGTAAALQKCLGEHIESDDSFQAHTLALTLLSSAKAQQQAAKTAWPGRAAGSMQTALQVAGTQTPAASADQMHANSTGCAGEGAAQQGGPCAAAFQAGTAAQCLRKAEAALQAMAMLAAESPACLIGIVSKLLSQAFPQGSSMATSELLQKWAIDVLYHMAGDATTRPEVCSSWTASLLLAVRRARLQVPCQCRQIQGASRCRQTASACATTLVSVMQSA